MAFALEAGFGPGGVVDLFDSLASEATQICLLGFTIDTGIHVVNRALARRLKCRAPDLIGRPVWPLLTDPDADTLRRLMPGPSKPTAGEFTVLNFVDADQHPFTLRSCGRTRCGSTPARPRSGRYGVLPRRSTRP